MSLQLHLPEEVEARVRDLASRNGKSPNAYAGEIVERAIQLEDVPTTDPRDVMRLPMEERRRILTEGTEAVADLFIADLALPVAERELTALTALDGDRIYDYSEPGNRRGQCVESARVGRARLR